MFSNDGTQWNNRGEFSIYIQDCKQNQDTMNTINTGFFVTEYSQMSVFSHNEKGK